MNSDIAKATTKFDDSLEQLDRLAELAEDVIARCRAAGASEAEIGASVDTGLNVVNVKDVAQGHLLACERGTPGERYILGSQDMTLGQILQELATQTGLPAPKIKLPYFVAWTAGMVTTALAQLTGIPPRAPMEAVRLAKKKMWVSHAKATRELGYHPGPAREALSDAIQWFKSR